MYNFKDNESLMTTVVDTVTPTTSTEGVVGQFYIDQSTDPASLYLCTKVETVDSTTTYTWTKQGGKQLYQHNISCYSTTFYGHFSIVNNIAEAYTTTASVAQWMYNNGFTSLIKLITATGHENTKVGSSTARNMVEGIFSQNGETLIWQMYNTSLITQNINIDDENITVGTSINSKEIGSQYSALNITDTVVAL